MPKTIFDPGKRIKALEEVIYPSILYSFWRTEEKIRTMYRHKIQLEKTLELVEDAENRAELYRRLEDIYDDYVTRFGFAPVERRKCEAEVKKEQEDMHAHTLETTESPEVVSISTRWMKAHVDMILAQAIKKTYTQQAWKEQLQNDLSHIERKLMREPDSQLKADVVACIARVRELLISE
ncbi:hypothetical protein CW713_10555 [Methanophagales archaeon]|nr:MAG: hypothetical protein CW713_10555 [Methanophagales archaeon]